MTKKARLDMVISELRKEKLTAYGKQSGMTMTEVVEFLIDTLKIKRKRNADESD